ncbi:hypothetical protein [Yersinia intermedia]|uniref:hypothetical protein n=1 Tax=Yersinia intermedia TaxID=631 RepID=UPI0022FE24E2|nr:hypothetical protein [Yersinia intermedia]MDA5514709.1 hypothetical protein [Yersinia intermedia]
MKNYYVALTFLIITPAIAFSENANNQILYLDKPYTITHLSSFDIDCVWTKDEQGRLKSEALGPDGSGVCWDEKAVNQVGILDKEKKLIWHDPPNFDYEYGNKNKCYYMVDKKGGFVNFMLGDNVTEAEADECRKVSNKEKALNLATKVEKKVEFGGYVATKKDILGSVVLACYTGSLDSDGMLVSKEEKENRYKELLGLYKGDSLNIKRINNAFNFARRNLSDRYPLDTRGQYRADVCDQMVLKGKL